MKKIKMTIAAATMFCAVAFAGYTAYDKATITDEEKLFLANIEALTDDDEDDTSWWDSKIYYCNPTQIWKLEWIQYKDVPKDQWEITNGDIDPEAWGWCYMLVDGFECISGNSVAHCWEC